MSELKFYELKCQRCGGELDPLSGGMYRCKSCGKAFKEQLVEDVADKLRNVLNEQKQESIANLRQQLWTEMHEQYINSNKIVGLARDIKKYLPDDYFANFCEVANSGNDRQVSSFLNNTSKADMADYADVVLDFMLKSVTAGNLNAISLFIERAFKGDPVSYDKYVTAYEREAQKVNSGIYELIITRDVFLAYSSKDIEKVLELCDYLERNKITCFLALRNLRHGRGAVDNYDQAIKTAINNCKTVVFVSSKNSRNMSCDAFTDELPYIRQKDLNVAPLQFRYAYDKLPQEYMMPRIEYLIEDYCGNIAERTVKEFFHGLEWCKNKEDVADRIVKYLTASYYTSTTSTVSTPAEPVIKKDQNLKYCKHCGTSNKLVAKFCSKCKGTEFVESYDDYLASKVKYCAICGTENNEEDDFCIECGSTMFVPTKKDYEDLKAQLAEDERRQKIKEEEEKRRREEAERRRIEEERKRKEEEERLRKLREEQERLRKEEEERKRKQREEEEKKRKEEENRLRKLREEQERLRAEQQLKKLQTLGDYNDLGDGYVTFGAYPQSVKADSVKIGKKFDDEKDYYLGSDNCLYAYYKGYYYKVEPIKWKVLSRGRECVIISDIILDAHCFDSSSNDYDHSEIRKWLNGEFNYKALRYWQKNKIETVYVREISLLSRAEVEQYSEEEQNTNVNLVHGKIGSDYAKAHGLSFGNDWWLCSTYLDEFAYIHASMAERDQILKESAQHVCANGRFDGAKVECSLGVLPILKIRIDFDIQNGTLVQYYGSDSNVIIPNSVTTIGKEAFAECRSLESVTIGNSVKSIGDSAFFHCISLKSVNISDAVTTVSENVFAKCVNLEDVTIGNGVKSIGDSAFFHCISLKSITLPKSVTTIGKGVFAECRFLKSVNILNGVTDICENAFEKCVSLESVKIPKSITFIDENAFSGCTKLEELIFEDEEFGNVFNERVHQRKEEEERLRSKEEKLRSKQRAEEELRRERKRREEEGYKRYLNENFEIQNDLLIKYKGSGGNVVIPDNIKSIGIKAFSDSLTVINFEVSSSNRRYKSVDGNLYSYDGKTLVRYAIGKKDKSFTVPDGVTSIGNGAFYGCTSLTDIIIPESVTSIGVSAFYGCESFTSITIPKGVVLIGRIAFSCCQSLKTIYCKTKKPLFGLPTGWDKEWLGVGEYKCKAKVIWG